MQLLTTLSHTEAFELVGLVTVALIAFYGMAYFLLNPLKKNLTLHDKIQSKKN